MSATLIALVGFAAWTGLLVFGLANLRVVIAMRTEKALISLAPELHPVQGCLLRRGLDALAFMQRDEMVQDRSQLLAGVRKDPSPCEKQKNGSECGERALRPAPPGLDEPAVAGQAKEQRECDPSAEFGQLG